jgi:hypothetical protein
MSMQLIRGCPLTIYSSKEELRTNAFSLGPKTNV